MFFQPPFPQSPHRSDQETASPTGHDTMGQMLLKLHAEGYHDCLIRADGQEFKVRFEFYADLTLKFQCFKVFLVMHSERFKQEQELQLVGPLISVDFGETKPNVVQEFISWIYNGWSGEMSDHVEELYKLAVEWQVPKLKVSF
jgi:hypothetical protein